MSRCFPFPPPGYEKKARTIDTDLLKKDKHEEKKHKKDKKDKEKKEGKEKRDKDRSKEKHREKKDRKEKHKDKDKDRDKVKNQTSDEKKVERQPGYYNGEKFGSNMQNNEIKNSIYVEDLARRIRDEDRASRSQMDQKVVATDQRRGEVWGSIGNQSQEKEKIKNKNVDHGKVNGQRNHIDTKVLEKEFGQNSFGVDEERVEGMVKSMEKKDTEKQMEGKEKNKHKESDGKGDKHKSKDREKSTKSKDKERDKEEKKDKTKAITEPSKEQPKLKDNVSELKEGSKDSLDFRNIKSPEMLKLSNVSPAAEGNLGKRKELERNGFLLDNGNRPSKFPRPVSSSHSVENGKKLEPCQTAVQFASEKQGLANNHTMDIKEPKINGLITAGHNKIKGIIAAQPHTSPIKPSSVRVPANENGETFSKPLHPDTKFLSQIFSVPEMEELPDLDDQEWLVSCNHHQSKKQSRGSPGIDEIRQVWAEAFRIESADISALPYVIPY